MQQVKQEVAAFSEDERWELQAFLMHLARKDDPEYRRDLKERLDRIENGDKVYLDEFIRLNSQSEQSVA